jgi:hypothetical protein
VKTIVSNAALPLPWWQGFFNFSLRLFVFVYFSLFVKPPALQARFALRQYAQLRLTGDAGTALAQQKWGQGERHRGTALKRAMGTGHLALF